MRRALVGLWALAAAAALAQPAPVKVCLPDIDAPPYLHREPQRPGVFNRLLLDAGQQAGLAVSVLRLPSARCRVALEQGEVDAMPLPVTPAYLEALDFPLDSQGRVDAAARLGRIQFVLLRRRGETWDWDGHRLNPSGVIVGMRRGVATLADRLQGLRVVLDDHASANEQLLNKLLARRIDLAAMSRQEFLAIAATQPAVEVLPLPLISADLHLAVSRRASDAARERLAAWREQLARLRDLPAYQADELRARAP